MVDPRRFDLLTQSLASSRTRRGLLGGLAALFAGVRSASGQDDCPAGQTRNKTGDCNCPAGTDSCPDVCYNLKSDPGHCGSCNNTCLRGEICTKGKCRCPSGWEICNGACVNPRGYQADESNCGFCGNECLDNEGCFDGSCKVCLRTTQTCVPGVDLCCGGSECLQFSDCETPGGFCC